MSDGLDIISYSIGKKAIRMSGNVGTKEVDLTGLIDGNIIEYDSITDKFIVKKNIAKVEQWKANHEYEKGEMFVFDDILWWSLSDFTSNNGSSPEIDEVNGLCMPFAKDLGFPNLIDLDYAIVNNGLQLNVTWTNPTADTFEGHELYLSETLDITDMRYDEIQNEVALGNVTMVSSGLGTGIGLADGYTHVIETRKTYYVKGFAKHYDAVTASYVYSSGRYFIVENPDITPPQAITDLGVSVVLTTATLTFTQPSDVDLLYTKIVRSSTGIPTNPTDGTVLGSIPKGSVGSLVDSGLTIGETYYYRAFSYDDAGNGMQTGIEGNYSASNGVTVIVSAKLGFDIVNKVRTDDAVTLTQEQISNLYPYNSISRAVVDSSGNVVYYLDEDDSVLQEDGLTPSVLDGTDGNVVVEIPEFYYKRDNGIIQISGENFTGATLIPRQIVGAFESSLDEINNKLMSVVGKTPITQKSITEFRTFASNVGVGWQLKDITFEEIIKALFLVEYGNFNSQTLIGNGLVNEVDVTETGSTVSLGNKTGVATNGAVSYHGIENPWGNVFEFIEGLYVTDTAYYKATSGFDTFADDGNTGNYTSTGQTPITSDGYISNLDSSGIIIGDATLGNNVDYVGDYQYSHKTGETNIAVSGGNYSDGDKAGLFRTHMGLRPFGKEVDMIETSAFGDYTGLTVTGTYTSNGVLVGDLTVGSVLGKSYNVSIPKVVDGIDIVSIDKIEIV